MIKHGFIRAANGVWLNLNIIDYLLIETENDFEDCFEVVANCNLDTNYIIENDFISKEEAQTYLDNLFS